MTYHTEYILHKLVVSMITQANHVLNISCPNSKLLCNNIIYTCD